MDTAALNVRTAPAANAEIVGQLVQGDKVTVFQEKFGWAKTFYNGQEAWVAAQFLLPINDEAVAGQESNEKATDSTKSSEKEEKQTESSNDISASPEINNNSAPPKAQATKQKTANRNRDALADYHIIIDPGHGGKDVGAIGVDGVYEKGLTLATAKLVAKQLQHEGATVTLTRSDDSFISLDQRVQISNSHKNNVFISLHYNAFDDPAVKGIKTFYYAGEENAKLAQTIQGALANHVNSNNRGANQADYYVLRNNDNAAILVELGFITNPEELQKIQTPAYQKDMAAGIADGVKDYFDD